MQEVSRKVTASPFDCKLFDKDYYERGLETGVSCYQNYRWIPELTIPMAMTLVDYLYIEPYDLVLDYGCAKGYLVKALIWLKRRPYGVDVSEYAVGNCDPEVKSVLFNSIGEIYPKVHFHYCIAKDVFEHVPRVCIDDVLEEIRSVTSVLFVCVPLGNEKGFVAPANDCDVTHCICEDEIWWAETFRDAGWDQQEFTFRIDGIKDTYYDKYPKAHGFFILQNPERPKYG